MRLITCCQPSGDVRLHEIRVRLPLSALVWHGAHFEITSASVIGMPPSSAGLGLAATGLAAPAGGGVAGGWARSERAAGPEINRRASSVFFMPESSTISQFAVPTVFRA